MLIAGCRTSGTASAVKDDIATTPAAATAGTPRLCAAIRGNGNLIFAHFTALARVLETYGLVDATAGGSSGSITQFIYESIFANPVLRQCAQGPCSNADAGARAGLLFKSLQGYLEVLGTTADAAALEQLAPLADQLKAAAGTQGVEQALATNDPATNDKLRAAIETVLTSQDLRDLVNYQELLDLLADAPPSDPQYGAKEVWAAIDGFGKWDTSTNVMFFRPGLINFKGLARKIGRIGSFYAGYGPADSAGMKAFLDACTTPTVGKSWSDVMTAPGPGGQSCGDTFLAMLTTYRGKLLANEAGFPSRVDDPVGKYLPVLISTSVLEGQGPTDAWRTADQAYLAGTQPVPFPMTFDGIRFGYWGRDADLAKVQANPLGFADLKTSKFLALGQDTWFNVLSASPAEPGLSHLTQVTPTRISCGGWSDLHPVLVLKNLGCQNVVYVTRRGEESAFAEGVARQFGVTDQQLQQLYSLDAATPPSSQALSIAQADGVWCTNWDAFDTPQLTPMSADAYSAPFEAHAGMAPMLVAYPNTKPNVNLRGCSVGAPPLPAP